MPNTSENAPAEWCAYHSLKNSRAANLTRHQHSLLLSAVDQAHDGASLRVELLHFRSIFEVVHGNLALSVAQYELALPAAYSGKQ